MKAPELKAPELKAHEFDRAFDAGEDVSGHVDWPQARRVSRGDSKPISSRKRTMPCL